MDWTSLIGPAVVAAIISGLVATIGIWISARTARRIHAEKLAFDEMQTERRIAADIALAEKRVALDRALAAWKRRSELAEEVLADFYQARRIFEQARLPGIRGDEGKSRPRRVESPEGEEALLDSYFAPAERLNDRKDFFAKLHARRYRFMTFFGPEAAEPFDDIHKVYSEIISAVKMLLMTHHNKDEGYNPQTIKQWKITIGWDPQSDPIPTRLEQIIEKIERHCKTAIEGPIQ